MKRLTFLLALILIASLQMLAQVPASRHIYVVAEENHSYERLVGSADMPYLNYLLSQGALATQFYANQHSSLPNYFWLTAGQPITLDNQTTLTYDVDNIVRRLLQKGFTYRSYAQSLPYPGYAGLYSGAYMKRHAPLPYFSDMGNSKTEMLKHVGVDQLLADIQNGTLPNFAFITPDGEHDMHNCPNGEAACQQKADQFLKTYVAPLLQTPAFQPGGDGLLILWSDEADLVNDDRCSANVLSGCGGRVVVSMIGPRVKKAYRSATAYKHEHLLRTILMAIGTVSNYPGAANNVGPMADMFLSSTSVMNITVQSPAAGSSTISPVHVQASATGPKPITAMKVYVDDVLRASAKGTSIVSDIAIPAGVHRVVFQAWDSIGTYVKKSMSVTIANGSSTESGILIQSPQAGVTLSSPVHVIASATNMNGVVATRVYVDNVARYSTPESAVDTYISMSSGTNSIVVQNWTSSGKVTKSTATFTVQ
jgi:hypothetical protein